MNTFRRLIPLILLITLSIVACAPTGTESAPEVPAIPEADAGVGEDAPAAAPITGGQSAELAPRLWSGEVSDNDLNLELNIKPGAKQDLQNGCVSEDSVPRRYSGCVE